MIPKNLDPRALKIVEDNNQDDNNRQWHWMEVVPGTTEAGFLCKRRGGGGPYVVTFEDLRDHQLAPLPDDGTTESDRLKGLRWLRDQIAKPNRKA
jgi:hypothetical protein